MKVLVFGATGGTGRAIVAHALEEGHEVTAFARDPTRMKEAAGLTVVAGDAINAEEVTRAVPGHHALVVSLGERPRPLDWLPGRRLNGSSGLCEIGTRNILAALPSDMPARVIIVSAFGVGATREKAPWYLRLYLRVFLNALMADKERQEALLKATDLDFLIVQPVALTDGPATGDALASTAGDIRKQQVSRADLAAFIVAQLRDGQYRRATVAFSG